MKKIRLFVLTLVVTLFLSLSNAAFASYTEYSTGYKGIYSLYDDTWLQTSPLVVSGKDSIISITVRLRSNGYSNVTTYIRSSRYTNDQDLIIDDNRPVTSTWTSPMTFNLTDGGYYSLNLYAHYASSTSAVVAQVEVLDVKYRSYSIDGTNMSMGSDGYVYLACTNNTPNGNISYGYRNTITNATSRNAAGTWIDTSVLNGKSYSYTLDWGFYPSNGVNHVDLGSIFVPIDVDLTQRVNTIISSVTDGNGNTISAVRDASGTVLSEARQAKTNSQNASTNALNAYNTAQTVNTKIDSLSTAVTNIQNNIGADTTPPIINLGTLSGARATSGNSIRAFLNVSDNISTTFSYSINNGVYQILPANGIIDLPVTQPGVNPIYVRVKDEAGNINSVFMTIRKL